MPGPKRRDPPNWPPGPGSGPASSRTRHQPPTKSSVCSPARPSMTCGDPVPVRQARFAAVHLPLLSILPGPPRRPPWTGQVPAWSCISATSGSPRWSRNPPTLRTHKLAGTDHVGSCGRGRWTQGRRHPPDVRPGPDNRPGALHPTPDLPPRSNGKPRPSRHRHGVPSPPAAPRTNLRPTGPAGRVRLTRPATPWKPAATATPLPGHHCPGQQLPRSHFARSRCPC